jgi:hypothetical protein
MLQAIKSKAASYLLGYQLLRLLLHWHTLTQQLEFQLAAAAVQTHL